MASILIPGRLAQVMEELSNQRKLSDLARRLGEADASKFSHYKGGRGSFPEVALLVKICRELNISADWLLGLSDTRELRHDEVAEPIERYVSVELTEDRLRAVLREELERAAKRRPD